MKRADGTSRAGKSTAPSSASIAEQTEAAIPERGAADDRNFVKQAVGWALRALTRRARG